MHKKKCNILNKSFIQFARPPKLLAFSLFKTNININKLKKMPCARDPPPLAPINFLGPPLSPLLWKKMHIFLNPNLTSINMGFGPGKASKSNNVKKNSAKNSSWLIHFLKFCATECAKKSLR